jgi:hypothetical protein
VYTKPRHFDFSEKSLSADSQHQQKIQIGLTFGSKAPVSEIRALFHSGSE